MRDEDDDLPVGLEHYGEHCGIRDGNEGEFVNADPGADPVPFTKGADKPFVSNVYGPGSVFHGGDSVTNRSGAYVPREASLLHEWGRVLGYGAVALFWLGVIAWAVVVIVGRFA